MRKLLIFAWLLLPGGAAAFHYYGPGHKWKELEDVSKVIAEADAHAAKSEWSQAVAKYDAALQRLPADRVAQVRHIRLGKSRARMFVGQLPQAHDDLEALLQEVESDAKPDRALVQETRAALANAQYYMTWLLRLEGLPETEWSPYIEGARQNYRLLSEGAQEKGDPAEAKQMKEDLDSSIRLARMDLNDLQALPLPSQ